MGAVHTRTPFGGVDWPVAMRPCSMNCWDCVLQVSVLGRIGGCYLRQQLLAKVQQPQLGVGLQTPQLVGVTNARIE